MTEFDKREIRGVSWRLAAVVAIGSLSVCSTVIWGVADIKSTIKTLDYRMTEVEKGIAAHEEGDKQMHGALWNKLTEFDNRIYQLAQRKN